ncbi:hypothetical protein WJX84_008217 [Apatococcus fuscideae]|uniref:Uncharacterized protein n=1 Tax=Apatococcus fuscideae TaxID=2026836 RepID=A0AAW1T5I0_9CHLO
MVDLDVKSATKTYLGPKQNNNRYMRGSLPKALVKIVLWLQKIVHCTGALKQTAGPEVGHVGISGQAEP